ncbi:hypothetical protein D3C74_428610 [compost metagenome]
MLEWELEGGKTYYLRLSESTGHQIELQLMVSIMSLTPEAKYEYRPDGRLTEILFPTGDKLVYDVGTSYKHWMIWNNNACNEFFCPEPQMNLVNAPNVEGISAEESGLVGLQPGELYEQTSRLYPIAAQK